MKVVITLDDYLNKIGMSQRELAKLTEIRQPSINEMCRNQTARLPLDNLAKICEILNCEITDILRLEKSQSE
ncbi:MAG: helix-turn-helix transcriptional regulator [Niallia sp.]|uniref:helix-turn-helix domain-containing protein n=1 Tax=Niallia sp. RD1 TaxID=2962858 RepID=UPI0020C1AE37|nr:helix-turn-helix transcriptional regulator [Niallia sp. RD1]MBQ6447268.1 helix-turn-helix transcriptional regulator [Bacillus sp. (in: firmicutes)]UTI44446.1 helix-turn-helix transcriptional regulator [Niallia sp. RD1]